MDFVLVFSLMLASIPTGLLLTSDPELAANSCHKMCPRGYRKDSQCNSTAYRCKKCEDGTFTNINNTYEVCRRCDTCARHEIEIKPCSFNSDTVCDCKDEYYNYSKITGRRNCQRCPCKPCKGHDERKGQSCENPECKRKCMTATPPPSATTTTADKGNNSSNSTNNPKVIRLPDNLNPRLVLWIFLLALVVAFLGSSLVLLLRYVECRPCWCSKEDQKLPAEDPKSNEKHSHQDSNATTLTFNLPEETPMMTLSQSPATPEHPAHYSPLLPEAARHKAAKQDELSEDWPAIVLYTIIKEVPLRRWKEFLRLLSVADQQLERVEMEAGLGLGSMERQYQMLRLWSQRSSASLGDVFSALHYMDLSGCAQLVQERLEKLQGTPELKQGFADHGFNGALHLRTKVPHHHT